MRRPFAVTLLTSFTQATWSGVTVLQARRRPASSGVLFPIAFLNSFTPGTWPGVARRRSFTALALSGVLRRRAVAMNQARRQVRADEDYKVYKGSKTPMRLWSSLLGDATPDHCTGGRGGSYRLCNHVRPCCMSQPIGFETRLTNTLQIHAYTFMSYSMYQITDQLTARLWDPQNQHFQETPYHKPIVL